ncbi:MAG: helix-turn-helix domain-containing protein, partial [Lachnospiraceae bacterium]|nr:helix-turn-helix domain-containing protein [bacterium]MDY5517967.1 helix-turn-helix domain-containing protein [Lachnospiraceae bacterium]
MKKNKHLSLDDRIRIDELLKESYSFKAIAGELGKNPTTIAREVRAHIVLRNV